jgi:hypothetical protein
MEAPHRDPCASFGSVHCCPLRGTPCAYNVCMNNQTMNRFEVYVPSAPYESESTSDLDRAWMLCLDLSEEFGYAQVRQNGMILGDYTNGGV